MSSRRRNWSYTGTRPGARSGYGAAGWSWASGQSGARKSSQKKLARRTSMGPTDPAKHWQQVEDRQRQAIEMNPNSTGGFSNETAQHAIGCQWLKWLRALVLWTGTRIRMCCLSAPSCPPLPVACSLSFVRWIEPRIIVANLVGGRR